MDIEAELRGEHTKRQMSRVAAWVGRDPVRFRRVAEIMLGDDSFLARRAAWVAGDACEAFPELAKPWLGRFVDHLSRPALPDAVVRHIFRVFQFVAIPPRIECKVLAVAMAALGGVAPIAVKAYALTVLRRLAERYPEILPEVRALIEEILPTAGPGIRARIRREFGSEAA